MVGLDAQSVTRILADFGAGDQDSMRALLPRVYDELRGLAAAHFADERTDHTLQPTALVHEAFVRLADQPRLGITSRGHFFRLASKVMRQILIDHARARLTLKRDAGGNRVPLTENITAPSGEEVDLIALENALVKLAELNPRKAALVELRFFGGLQIEEAADVLAISRTQATREWRTARAWLADELAGGDTA